MTDSTAPDQKPPHLFQKGQSGNPAGRPKGSRGKLGESFISALAKSFEQHGEATIETMRTEDPSGYCKIVASLLPKEHTGEGGSALFPAIRVVFADDKA